MPVYEFSFPAVAAGLTVNFTGAHTGSATVGSGGLYLLDADTEGLDEHSTIVGEVSSSLLWTLQTRGVYQLQDSIAAGGGGIDLDGAEYAVELSTGQSIAPEGTEILAIDTVSDGLTLDGTTAEGLEPGLYLLNFQFDFTKPAEDRFIKLTAISGAALNPSRPLTLHSEGSEESSYAYDQMVVLVIDGTLALNILTTVLSDAVDPDDLVMTYGFAQLNRLG